MNKNCIFCAYAYLDGFKGGVALNLIDDQVSIYIKNAIVSLVSAKKNNEDCDVALVTNIKIPQKYKSILESNDILVKEKEFDRFKFDKDYKWSLAFYKLCALEKMLEEDYENYLLIDTDTYIQSSLEDLWEDTKYNIMLYNLNRRINHENYKRFNEEIKALLGIDEPITKYGGEFIAGNKKLLSEFINECNYVFEIMKEKEFRTNGGDEFIIAVAGERMKKFIKSAGGYVYRFWTGRFRLVSTCYLFDPVSILHVPREKNYGMMKLYNYIEKHKCLPANKKVYNVLHLRKVSFKIKIAGYINKIKIFSISR